MSSEKDKNKTTVNDIKDWLEYMFESKGLTFPDRKLKRVEQEVWGMEVIDEKQVFAFFTIDDAEPGEISLEMCSVLGKEPKSNLLSFYRKCLELNRTIFRGSISVNEARVSFVQNEFLQYISFETFVQMFTSHISDTKELYETLTDEFEILEIVDSRSMK